MFIIQLRKSSISQTVLLITLLVFSSADMSTSNQRICEKGNTRNVSYFKVDSGEVNWDEAWSLCNNNGSTLPVICDQHEQDAFTNYLKANIGSSAAWTSGRMIKFSEWKWVNGQAFNRTGVIDVAHPEVSYTHVWLENVKKYKAFTPSHREVYLCQYSGSSCKPEDITLLTNGCVRPSHEFRTWYDARNHCVKNGGDLAILNDNDLVTLREKSSKWNASWSHWIGLRKNAWYWIRQAAVPSDDSGEDVKYSNWSNDTYSSSGEYISIEASNGDWKAASSTDKKKVVCQASSDETTSSKPTSSTLTTSRPAIASKSSSTTSRPSIASKSSSTTSRPSIASKSSNTTSRSTISSKSSNTTNRPTVSSKSTRRSRPSSSSKSSSATSTMSIILLSTTTNAMSSMSESATQSTTNIDSEVLLYSGVGAGIVIIIICIIVIILAVRCTRKSHKDNNGSNVKNNSEQNRLDLSPNKPVTSSASAPANTTANASANAPIAVADDTQGVYAEISLETLHPLDDGAKTQQPGILYAALEFQKEPTYLEPDQKRAHTTDATKVAPMGDIIYATPDSKSHAVASPGNESASHPSKVTPQGDIYALPVKNSKSPNENPPGGGIYENL